ncbi:hypothetical protein BGZ57DRAFT_1004849 [Hyaloscypha finlandica]|nr:hypothetical protein BGZ57DRAFT_1004849 [Hyaloscypha finlandica]
MASPLPPKVHTYHCVCTSFLLASTHSLSTLPRRSTSNSPASDAAIILPLPSSPPTLSPGDADLPQEGYSLLLGMAQDKKVTIVRKEDGFEKRICWRCERCGVIVGYELQTQTQGGEAMDLDGGEKGKGKEEGYQGKVVYLLPGGVQSTDVMMGRTNGGKRIGEQDVAVKGVVAVFE